DTRSPGRKPGGRFNLSPCASFYPSWDGCGEAGIIREHVARGHGARKVSLRLVRPLGCGSLGSIHQPVVAKYSFRVKLLGLLVGRGDSDHIQLSDDNRSNVGPRTAQTRLALAKSAVGPGQHRPVQVRTDGGF